MGAVSALSILADLREHGAHLMVVRDRVHIGGVRRGDLPHDLVNLARVHRDDLRRLVEREAAAGRTAEQWRARLEVLAAEKWHIDEWPRERARSWAYIEVLVEWTEAHPDVDVLPNAQAEAVARSAMAELGIVDPTLVERT